MGCRGLDPIGDTESPSAPDGTPHYSSVAEGSIRLGILKGNPRSAVARHGVVAEGSIRLGILKDSIFVGIAHYLHQKLQRARSDWGY